MSFLRRDLFPLTAALLAALAVLFVSSVSMACEAPVDQDMMVMSMTDDGAPCQPKAIKTTCQKACVVFCQSLVPQGGNPTPARIYSSVRYPSLDAPQADFCLEADDPPPRL